MEHTRHMIMLDITHMYRWASNSDHNAIAGFVVKIVCMSPSIVPYCRFAGFTLTYDHKKRDWIETRHEH